MFLRPLAPMACHTSELRFIALTTGVLSVDGVRVVDISASPSVTTECRDLPSVVSLRRPNPSSAKNST